MYEVWGGWVLTSDGIKENHSLVIDKDIITDMGPRDEMRKKYSFNDSIGKYSRVVCPGFVDAHMHSYQIATKGLTADESLLEWLKKYIWKWEGELTKEKARACAEAAYLHMLHCGITSFSDYTSVHHADEAFRAAKRFGMRAVIGKTLMDRNSPPELEQDTDTCLKETENLLRKWHGQGKGLLNYAVTPRFCITATDSLLRGCKKLCSKYKVLFRTHTEENKDEVKWEKKTYGKSSVQHLDKLGLLNERALLTHCVWTTRKDIDLIAKKKVSVAHCPGSNMLLASGTPNIPYMLEKGVNVALGTDVAAYYNFSMFEQARLSCLMQKEERKDPHAMDHLKAFAMATKNGAKALRLGNTGEIKIGNKADIILLSTTHLAFSPLNDVISQIVYSTFPFAVDSVICNGRVLMREREVQVTDAKKVMYRSKEILGVKK